MADELDTTNLPEALREEIEGLTQADRAAVLLLLLGEDEAANLSLIHISEPTRPY